MSEDSTELGRIERGLELARAAVNQQNPDRAITLVNSLHLADNAGGLERQWAESRLILAEAYAATGDVAAEALFEEALELVRALPQVDHSLEVRVYEHWGDYLGCFAMRRSLALQKYETAKKKAIALRTGEDSARIQLKIEMIELTMDGSPELDNFKTLKRAGKQTGCTSSELLAVWVQHKGEISQHQAGLRYARNKTAASEQYFIHL
jgi:hypothetical protein